MSALAQSGNALRTQLRIARPVSDLELSVAMYRHGLGLHELGRFQNHAGFDGVMLGWPGMQYHLEFTFCRAHPVLPTPTEEDLLVLYVADEEEWTIACERLLAAGFLEATAFNPYWRERGRTFRDRDGYNVVLQRSQWSSR